MAWVHKCALGKFLVNTAQLDKFSRHFSVQKKKGATELLVVGQ